MRKKYLKTVCLLLIVLLFFASCAKERNAAEDTTDVPETATDSSEYDTSLDEINEDVSGTTTESSGDGSNEVTKIAQKKDDSIKDANSSNAAKTKETNITVNLNEKKVAKDLLLDELNKELAKKKFSVRANNLLRDVLDRLYENYPNWRHVFKDLPPTDQYIRVNFIGAIKYINNMHVVDADSSEGKTALDNGSAYAFVDEDKDLTLYYEKETENYYENNLETLYHEVTHCRQQMVFDDSYFKGNEMLRDIIVEGGATFHMKFICKNTSDMGGSGYIDKGDNSETKLNYFNNNGNGYPFEKNIYEHLIYLAGFDCINKMELKKISLSDVKKQIAQNYGNEAADSIWKELKYFLKIHAETVHSKKVFDEAVKLQKIFLNVVKTDIENLDTRNPVMVKRFINIYRSYKLRMLVKWEEWIGDRLVVISDEKFNIDYYDNLMMQKIIDSGVVNFSSDSSLNRMAVKALIFATNNYYTIAGVDGFYFLPEDLENAKYTYKEYKNSGELIISDKSNKIKIPFDRNKILKSAIEAL